MSEEIHRVSDPAQSDRCQNVSPARGQCMNVAMPQQKFCKAHISSNANQLGRESRKLYDLAMFRARMDDMLSNEDFRTLSEELSLSRILLEELFKSTKGETNLLIINSTKINDCVSRIQKLVQAIHLIEKNSGELLDKNSIVQLAGNIINIITKYVDDVEAIKNISNDILEEVRKMRPQNLET